MKKKSIFLGLFLASIHPLFAQETFYVATNGDDNNPGTISQPFASIERARNEVRLHNQSMTDDITVYIRSGKYYMNHEIEFDERDSGFNGHQVIYKGYNGEFPEIYGGQPVTGWQLYNGSIYRTFIGVGTKFHNLCENDDGAIEARSPYFNVDRDPMDLGIVSFNFFQRSTTLPYDDADIPDSYDLSQAMVHVWTGAAHWNWDPRVSPILSIDKGADVMTLRLDMQGDQYTSVMKGARYYVRGVPEFLDEQGEFFMDKNDGYLYYWPRSFPIEDQHIVRPTTDMLFKVMGSSRSQLVKNIRFENMKLQLSETTTYNNRSDFMEKAAPRDSRKIVDGRQGLVYVENAENIKIRYCKLFSAGIHGVALSFYAKYCEVYGCWIKDVGNQAISACGYTPDLHPFHYEMQYMSNTVAQAPSQLVFHSVAEGNVNGHHNLSNNRIQNLGFLTGNSTGIKMYISSFNTVTNNDVSNGPRHGISQSGPRANSLEQFDPRFMEKDGIVWGESASGQAGLYRSRSNVVMFNNLYQLVKDSNDVGPLHLYGTGWDPAQLSNFDEANVDANKIGEAWMDEWGNPIGNSVGKYRNNVFAHNVMHDFYGMYDAGLFFGLQNDDDSNYCVQQYNFCYNWGAPSASHAAFNVNKSEHLSRYTTINGQKRNNNLWEEPNSTVITKTEAETKAKAFGINWDNVGLRPDHPWPPSDMISMLLKADATFGALPLTVNFDASQHTSYDPAPTFEWDFDGDGVIDQSGPNPNVQHTFATKGAYQVKVKLTENTGESATATIKITAGGTLSRSPILRYRFDEISGTAVPDSTGNGYNGTINGSPSWLPSGGQMFGALDLNGSATVTVPAEAFDTVLDGYTIMFWTKNNSRSYTDNTWFHATDSSGHIVYKMESDVGTDFLHYFAGYDANLNPPTDNIIYDSSISNYIPLNELLYNGGQWTHWAFRKNASVGAMDIFRNGNYLHDNTRDYNQLGRFNVIKDIQQFIIGGEVGGGQKFKGIIDDFRLYDVMLSPTEIKSAMLADLPPAAPTDIINIGGDTVDGLGEDGDFITTFTVVDPNADDSHTWELLDDAGGRFVLDPNFAQLRIGNAAYIHAGAAPAHDLVIRVTDNTGRSLTKTVTINVQNGQAAPPYASPKDASGCIFWLDANDLDGDGKPEGIGESGQSGGNISTWADKSGSGNNATQSTSAAQPKLVANVLGGKPVVRMDGADDFLSFSDITTGKTFFWVAKDDSLGVDTKLHPIMGDNNKYQLIRGNSSLWHGSFAPASVKQGITRINGQDADGTTADLSAGYNIVSLQTDDAETPPEVSQLAKDRNLNPARVWDGDFTEVLIYNRVLTNDERDRVAGYLDAKWVNPISGNIPPNSLLLSNSAVPQNAGNNQTIGTLSATDPNAGDSISFSMLNDAGGRFKLSGNSLQVANASALSAGANYDVIVAATDNGGLAMSRTFELTVDGTGTLNIAPKAIIVSTPASGVVPLSVSLSATSSRDPDGTIQSYAWDIGNDGTIDSTATTVAHTFTTAGMHHVKLSVTDNGGKTSSSIASISVIPKHTITATAGSNGTISPIGSITVAEGFSQSFSITPDSGYLVQDVLIDGVSIGRTDSYTFDNITEAHTISCSFMDLSQVSMPNLLVHYKFDETSGTTATDSSGNNHNGTFVSQPNWLSSGGKIGGAFENTGGNYVTVPVSAFANLSTSVTVSCWIKGSANKANLFYGTAVIGNPSMRVLSGILWPGGFAYDAGHIAGDDYSYRPLSGNAAPDASQWEHWVLSSENGGDMTVYRNGVEVATRAQDRDVAGIALFKLGQGNYGTYVGSIDDFRIYDDALSPLQAQALFSQGGGSTAPTGFAGWATSKGLSGNSEADTDSDGVKDFAEYAFNMNPNSPADKAMAGSFAVQTNGDVVYRFAKPIQGITHTVQYTSDLTGIWTNYTGTETDLGSQLEATIPGSAAANGKLYIRLRLEE